MAENGLDSAEAAKAQANQHFKGTAVLRDCHQVKTALCRAAVNWQMQIASRVRQTEASPSEYAQYTTCANLTLHALPCQPKFTLANDSRSHNFVPLSVGLS